MGKLRDFAIIRTGVAPVSCAPELANSKYVQIKDFDPARRILTQALAPTAGRATPIGANDLLVASRGEQTLAIRPDMGLVGAYPTLDIYLVRPEPSRLDPDYLAAYLSTEALHQQLRSSKVGSKLARIPKEVLEDLEFPVPSLERQRVIAQLYVTAKHQMDLIERLRSTEQNLIEARLSLAFAGLKD